MRIFHIISHFDLGGAERVALNICKSQSDRFEYHLVEVSRGKSDFTDNMLREMDENGICYHRAPISSTKLAIMLFPFWFLFLYLRFRPKVIHTHTEVPDLSIYLWHFLCPWHQNFVRTIHNTKLWNNWKFIGKRVEHFFQNHSSNVAISESTQQQYVHQFGGECPPIVYNGLAIREQQPFPHLKKGKINILFAGRFEYQKGIDQLIEVITDLKDDDRFFFHIVGTGSMKHKLETAVSFCRNVALYSKVYGLSSYLESFDYLFMPSNFEGLPLLSIEASLAKTPTISSDCKGLHETLPEDWSLKVPENTAVDYVKLLLSLDVTRYSQRAQEVYDFATTHFSLKRMQDSYEKIYKSVMIH